MTSLLRLGALLAGLLLSTGTAGAGTVERHETASPALGRPLVSMVYVPDGEPPVGGWPTLYLLHGHNSNETNWLNRGDIEATLDRMIADRRIRPLVVVMPRGDNSWYVDSKAVGGPGDYETAFVQDLRGDIETSFPVRRDQGGRAIAGFSMGGFGALHLALANPDLYASVASLSGAIWHNVPSKDLDKTGDELDLLAEAAYFNRVDLHTILVGIVLPQPGHFNGAFGTPFDARLFNSQNIFTLLSQQLGRERELPAMYLSVGDDDSHKLWRGAIALFETMQADGRDAELRITDGDHVWDVWKESIKDALVFMDHQFTDAATIAEDQPGEARKPASSLTAPGKL